MCLNYWTLRLISISKFNRWLITHFCLIILARIHSARLSWSILTKNIGHISARIYLAQVISAFVGWIISADKHFARNILAKIQPRLAWISEGRFCTENFGRHIQKWPGTIIPTRTLATNAMMDIQSSWIFESSFFLMIKLGEFPCFCKDSPTVGPKYFPLLLQHGRWELADCVTDSQGK